MLKKKNNSAALGQGPGSPQVIYITISLNCFADTEIPTRWEKLTVCSPQARRSQTGWNQKVDDADAHLPPTSQKKVHELITTSSNHYYKTPHSPLQVGTHSFEGISPLWPPLPGKAIKLFFSTSPKTLSSRFNSVSGYRGWIQLPLLPFSMMASPHDHNSLMPFQKRGKTRVSTFLQYADMFIIFRRNFLKFQVGE